MLFLWLQSADAHRRLLLREANEQLVATARLLAAEHGRVVVGAEAVLRVLRNAPSLAAAETVACNRLLEAAAADAPSLASLTVWAGNGAFACGSADQGGANAGASDFHRAAMSGETSIGLVDGDAGAERPVLGVAVPILDDNGQPTSVLAAALRMPGLAETAQRLALAQPVALTLVDRRGIVLGSTVPGLAMGARAPWGALDGAAGVASWGDQVLGVAPARGGEVAVVATRPASVEARADMMFRREMALALLVLVGAALFAFWVGEVAIGARLRRLAERAERVAQGRHPTRALGVTVGDEVGRLANALASMVSNADARLEELAAREAIARHAALHDSLTGLPNRRAFAAELEQALLDRGGAPEPLGVLALDLDRFKAVNDSFGHATGDALLVAASQRMTRAVREQDRVTRVAGDEFTILLPRIESERAAEHVAERVVSSLARPFEVDGRRLHTGTSVGIAIFPQDGITAEQLLAAADRALYRAKRSGRGTWRRAGLPAMAQVTRAHV